MYIRKKTLELCAGVACAAMMPVMGWCQSADRHHYALSSQDLGDALHAVSAQSGWEILFRPEDVEGRKVPGLDADMSVPEVISSLLKDTPLVAGYSDRTIIIRGRGDAPSPAPDTTIIVTGSRIRGAPVASPVLRLAQSKMLEEGQTTLTEVIRTIPQNFGGGQNPGVGLNVPGSSNASGASTLNLRGLGGDATLTLLNGHRLAYNVNRQSVDISSIPLLAVDRLEIVADGASALYGSDAVAGVANIVLKRDYQGLTTMARLGASTEGGNFQQQYGLVGGSRWKSGGIILAYDYERDTAIDAADRDYAASRSPGLTLYPALRHHNALLSLHQDLTNALSFELDTLYNKRWSDQHYAIDARGDYLLGGGRIRSTSESYAIAPTLKLDLPGDWKAGLGAIWGRDQSDYASEQYYGGMLIYPAYTCYCNRAKSVEFNAEGPLFTLPGGPARVALGGGFRRTEFEDSNAAVHAAQNAWYGYGELNLPFISPEEASPLGYRLNLSAALRYEDYPGTGDVLTPKFGIIYAPTSDIDVKASWGKSFRAPTLYQRYVSTRVGLYSAASRGGSGYPAGSTAILLLGGNPDLGPERATSWSATLGLHPHGLDGGRIEISYFHVTYRDRIVAPISFTAQALSNPIYGNLVNFSPSSSDIAAAIARGAFINTTGQPYNPTQVVAIIDNSNLNAARQIIDGVDIDANMPIDLGTLGGLTLSANGSYLDSNQQLSALQPTTPLAGELFNPPHVRIRAGATWQRDGLSLAAFVNHSSRLEDRRFNPPVTLGAMTTAEITAHAHMTDGPPLLRNIDIALAVRNLFNSQPSLIQGTQIFETPYDSTNASPFGRFISLTITKDW